MCVLSWTGSCNAQWWGFDRAKHRRHRAEEREEISVGKGPLFVDSGLTIRQSVPTLWEVKSQSLPWFLLCSFILLLLRRSLCFYALVWGNVAIRKCSWIKKPAELTVSPQRLGLLLCCSWWDHPISIQTHTKTGSGLALPRNGHSFPVVQSSQKLDSWVSW